MLREKEIYDAFGAGHVPAKRPIAEKIESLFRRFEEGVDSLFTNRQQRLKRQRKLFEKFKRETFVIDQSEMRFVP